MPERTIESREVFRGRLLRVRVDQVEMESGRRAEREIVEHPGAVAILAWDGSRLAMVSQWRAAAGGETLEIPAGTLEPGEDPLGAARRELAEECGLGAESWEEGPAFFTAPGFCTERLTVFLATGLGPVSVTGPDDEAVTGSWLSLPDAVAAVDGGRVIDSKSMVGIGWLARRFSRRET